MATEAVGNGTKTSEDVEKRPIGQRGGEGGGGGAGGPRGAVDDDANVFRQLFFPFFLFFFTRFLSFSLRCRSCIVDERCALHLLVFFFFSFLFSFSSRTGAFSLPFFFYRFDVSFSPSSLLWNGSRDGRLFFFFSFRRSDVEL